MMISRKLFVKVLGIFGAVSHSAHAAGKYRDDVHVLMYETDASLEEQQNTPLHFFRERSEIAGLKTTVYGSNFDFRGFGDKYQSLRPILEVIDPDTLIILSDARDVALNVPEDEDMAIAAVENFVETFKRITKDSPNAIVLSAEAQCCVSAMSHAQPSEYFDAVTGKRNKRACFSGHKDCHWAQNENINSWVDFMHERAYNKTGLQWQEVGDVYLNAGLMAGYPEDLINLLKVMDIHPSEDDQAVLTGLLYSHPEMVVLDYGQEMFGNNQWTRGVADGCIFESYGSDSPLIHMETQTQPLMVHTPGKFYACLDILIEALGGKSQQRYHPDTRKLMSGRLSLAAQLGLGGAAGEAEVNSEPEVEVEPEAEVEPVEASVEPVEASVEPEEASFLEAVPDNYGPDTIDDSENYGQYGNYGSANYGQYGNYGEYLAEQYAAWWDQYGDWWTNYGRFFYWGNYGTYRRKLRRRAV